MAEFIYTSTNDANRIFGYASGPDDMFDGLVPSGYTVLNTSGVNIPAEVSTVYSGWTDFVESTHGNFYTLSGTTVAPAQLSGIVHLESLSTTIRPQTQVVFADGHEILYPGPELDPNTDEILSSVFVSAQVSTKVDLSDEAFNQRGRSIIASELSEFANYAAITGSGVPSGVAFVTQVCNDYTTVYASGEDAKLPFQLGASGIAVDNGYAWGPPALTDP